MMNRKYVRFFRKTTYFLIVVMTLTSLEAAASQTGDKLKETGKKLTELEQQKKDAAEKVGALKEQENSLQGELSNLNQQLSEVSASINELELNIQEKEEEIQTTVLELAQAQEIKAQQYESMKLRIQYIYENGNSDLAAVLLDSGSMTEFLNKAEYIEEVNQYDRRMLTKYEDVCRQVTEKQKTLEAEQANLVSMQESMEQKKEEVNSLIAQTQGSIQAKQGEISEAQETVDEYEAQIAKMKAYEEELERKKAEEAKKQAAEAKKRAEEEKKRAAEQKKADTGTGSGGSAPASGGGTVTSNASDLAMLAALVECEAGGESYEGQLAVASVVVNRVKSGSFPNSISGVIYQGGQFSPVASGRFAVVLAKGAGSSCTQAASAALSGGTNVSFLYFCRASSGVEGTVIGNHVFY